MIDNNNGEERTMAEALVRTLYHHPKGGATVVEMLTGTTVDFTPPPPTPEEEEMVRDIVAELLELHRTALNEAIVEVTSEDPETKL